MFDVLRTVIAVLIILILVIIFRRKFFKNKKAKTVTLVLSIVLFVAIRIALYFVPFEFLGVSYKTAEGAFKSEYNKQEIVYLERGVDSSLIFYGKDRKDPMPTMMIKTQDGWKFMKERFPVMKQAIEDDDVTPTFLTVCFYRSPYSQDCYVTVDKTILAKDALGKEEANITDSLNSRFTLYHERIGGSSRVRSYCAVIPKNIDYTITVDNYKFKL